MESQETEYKQCSACKYKVNLAYGNIDGRHWFCVDCLVTYPLLADVGLVEMYYRFSTPYYGFPQLTLDLRQKMRLSPKQFKKRKKDKVDSGT
ncbi:hypothetical protein LCGC14_1422890 [marine sediment metagenome]|uniref:Uncharacterized protein n=1 Tax=marine sediment metagenome TaxID=412755 RepID=A0A0F9MSH8_9ZZZZ